ncbi:ankyrin repeat-containing domain protein [Ustulina deusta]|nr:ankyrin repeat-containing domain protein [Ustulina deusta]
MKNEGRTALRITPGGIFDFAKPGEKGQVVPNHGGISGGMASQNDDIPTRATSPSIYTPSTTAATNSPAVTNQNLDRNQKTPSQAGTAPPELPLPAKLSPANPVTTDSSPELRGRTPLQLAVLLGNFEIAKFLVSRGCNVNTVTATGQTVLHIAATCGYAQLVRYLIPCGVNLNHQDDAGNTALHLAVLNRHNGIVEMLVHSGAEMDITNKY